MGMEELVVALAVELAVEEDLEAVVRSVIGFRKRL
jgi:hypothetical protein